MRQSQLISFIEREITKENLIEIVFRDSSTGTWNRRAFDTIEVRESETVVVADVDSLKYINDKVSHEAGDDLIVEVAQQLRLIFKDDIYRIGGDEFVMITVLEPKAINKLIAVLPIRKFSYGLGPTLHEADKNLGKEKELREDSGLRSCRGLCPPWQQPPKLVKREEDPRRQSDRYKKLLNIWEKREKESHDFPAITIK
jgi:GGDEF domain-containing protein